MSDLTPDELEALNADFSELRPSRWRSFWANHDEHAFYFVVGWSFGCITMIAAFDVWLYFLA